MRIAMLGWEYPPHIVGGLGTACEGLSRALARHSVEILFVVPRLHGDENAGHMRLVDSIGRSKSPAAGCTSESGECERMTVRVPAALKPYMTAEAYIGFIEDLQRRRAEGTVDNMVDAEVSFSDAAFRYGATIFDEVASYAERVAVLLAGEQYDVIHGHDWMTYPAAVALARRSGKPVVLHVHSIERDRSGEGANRQISEIERWGLSQADSIVAVSHYTKALLQREYQIPSEKIRVVHNGIYSPQVREQYRLRRGISSRVVLFLGRITFQKGPDYFVEAAAKVVPHVPDVLFVMAGMGDMLPRMVQRVRELGIERYFHFPGFVRGQEVEQMYSLADVYVMPSVSEPFGIAALEAISYDTPVIISRQSGVAEVLSHALKVDFWDIDRMADLIINALLHEEMRADMVSMAREELRRLHWDAAAAKTLEVYRAVGNGGRRTESDRC